MGQLFILGKICLEEPDLPYEDGLYTLFIYTDGEQANLTENLVQLLRFMKATTRENAVNADLKAIQKMVDDMKQREETKYDALQGVSKSSICSKSGCREEVRKAYMKFHELLQVEREAGEEAERQKAERLVAEANARADQANERADQEKNRADQAEITIVSLKRELEKYKKLHLINENQ